MSVRRKKKKTIKEVSRVADKEKVFDGESDPGYEPSRLEAVKKCKELLDRGDDFILLAIKKGEGTTKGVSMMSSENLTHFIHALKAMKEECVDKI